MDRNSHFCTDMHNRNYEQTGLTGFFDPDGYGMTGCSMFHRSARIDLPAKPHRVENSANSSTTRTTRHGRNPHSSGIFTFYSFEEGSNFVQNIRQHRTSSTRWSVSFRFTFSARPLNLSTSQPLNLSTSQPPNLFHCYHSPWQHADIRMIGG